MLFKLAIKNVKKSYKDFSIYFLTLFFSVALFYTFNSFGSQQMILEMSESQRVMMQTMTIVMQILSIAIAVVCGFLVLYANSFLIKRRKKELGLYMLLGMKEGDVSKILVMETVLIGSLSLIVGLGIGYALSQGIVLFTASILAIPINYKFMFSMHATSFTVISFLIIFFIVMLFNTGKLRKYKLIELLKAGRKNQEQKLRNPVISIVLFLVSIGMLGATYWLGVVMGIMLLLPIVILGAGGTFLFFYSLSGFLLQFLKARKNFYYKNLNMFTLRQINANINHNFISVSLICLMLLISMGALISGFGLNTVMKDTLHPLEKFHMSINYTIAAGEKMNISETLKWDKAAFEKEYIYDEYYSGLVFGDLSAITNEPEVKKMLEGDGRYFAATKLSHYNQIREAYDLKPIELGDNAFIVIMKKGSRMDNYTNSFAGTMEIFGREMVFDQMILQPESMRAGLEQFLITGVVVKDEVIPEGTMGQRFYSIELTNKNDIEEVAERLNESIREYNEQMGEDFFRQAIIVDGERLYVTTGEEIKEMIQSIILLFTYIGLYVGVMFVLCSVVILALQQLSQANENQIRYSVLSKLGVSEKMMNQSIFWQIVIYFLLPLILACVHTIFGVKVVLDAFEAGLGIKNLILPVLQCGIIILLIYVGYFVITVQGSKRIIYGKK